jgi:hypothetical protein
MATVRKVGAEKYHYTDPRRYITPKDCPNETEVIRLYCVSHPDAVCVGGYAYFGCRPKGMKRENFVKSDLENRQYVRADQKIVHVNETYCGRKLPIRLWRGKQYYENQIWNRSDLGHPDLVDCEVIIEAKGGMPSATKVAEQL